MTHERKPLSVGQKKSKIRWKKWNSKFMDKPSITQKTGGKIIPQIKFCKRCKNARVKFHHIYCNNCWLINKQEKDGKL
jgi:hypothetical protein